jgi:hypothetical protein
MEIVCPHCTTVIPAGASVCTGCQAERRTGIRRNQVFGLMLLGGTVGMLAGARISVNMAPDVAIMGAIATPIVGAVLLSKRVRWMRMYRTSRR